MYKKAVLLIIALFLFSCTENKSIDSTVVNGWILTSFKSDDKAYPDAKGFIAINENAKVSGEIKVKDELLGQSTLIEYKFSGKVETKNEVLNFDVSTENEENERYFLISSPESTTSYSLSETNRRLKLSVTKPNAKKMEYEFIGIRGKWKLTEKITDGDSKEVSGSLELLQDGTFLKKETVNGVEKEFTGDYELLSIDELEFTFDESSIPSDKVKIQKLDLNNLETLSVSIDGGVEEKKIRKYMRD